MRLVQYQLLALGGCGRLARSVCFVSATVMKGLRFDNNKRVIFGTANNKDPSRYLRRIKFLTLSSANVAPVFTERDGCAGVH